MNNNEQLNYDVKNAKIFFDKVLKDYHSKEPKRIMQAKEDAITFLNGLSYSIAKNHFFEYIPEHISELMQEGTIGILKGLKKYNLELGAPSTFFYWYIKHEMQEYVNKNILKTSEYYSVIIKKVKAAINRICKKKETYTVDDIIKDTKLSKKTVQNALKIMYYETNIYYDGCTQNIKNKIDKEKFVDVESILIEKEKQKTLKKILKETLTETEQFIVQNLMGINPEGKKMTYNEIGILLNLSLAKVRRISIVAIEKLRNSELYFLYKDDSL